MAEQFKFRAECLADVREKWLAALADNDAEVEAIHCVSLNDELPDVEVTFYSDDSLDEIRDVMRQIIDGHVMWQTVAPIAEYTGQRNFEV